MFGGPEFERHKWDSVPHRQMPATRIGRTVIFPGGETVILSQWARLMFKLGVWRTMRRPPSPTFYIDRARKKRWLHESSNDRQHIREALSGLVPRTEYDRVLGQALDRINALERTVARIYGGIAVVVLLMGMLGVILRVVLG